VLAIKSIETDETLERWQFDIHTEDGPTTAGAIPGAPKPTRKPNKTEKEVQGEIRDIMKQITSTVTFLPILDDECEWGIRKGVRERSVVSPSYVNWAASPLREPPGHRGREELTAGTFTILAYTNDSEDSPIPATWGDADPHLIDRGKVEQVRLRSFSTNVHSLEAMVAYRVGE
jgi:mitotic spindle assembly checkpoint protein MAD2